MRIFSLQKVVFFVFLTKKIKEINAFWRLADKQLVYLAAIALIKQPQIRLRQNWNNNSKGAFRNIVTLKRELKYHAQYTENHVLRFPAQYELLSKTESDCAGATLFFIAILGKGFIFSYFSLWFYRLLSFAFRNTLMFMKSYHFLRNSTLFQPSSILSFCLKNSRYCHIFLKIRIFFFFLIVVKLCVFLSDFISFQTICHISEVNWKPVYDSLRIFLKEKFYGNLNIFNLTGNQSVWCFFNVKLKLFIRNKKKDFFPLIVDKTSLKISFMFS